MGLGGHVVGFEEPSSPVPKPCRERGREAEVVNTEGRCEGECNSWKLMNLRFILYIRYYGMGFQCFILGK